MMGINPHLSSVAFNSETTWTVSHVQNQMLMKLVQSPKLNLFSSNWSRVLQIVHQQARALNALQYRTVADSKPCFELSHRIWFQQKRKKGEETGRTCFPERHASSTVGRRCNELFEDVGADGQATHAEQHAASEGSGLAVKPPLCIPYGVAKSNRPICSRLLPFTWSLRDICDTDAATWSHYCQCDTHF